MYKLLEERVMIKHIRIFIMAILITFQAIADDPIKINLSLVFTENELLTQELIKVTDQIRERSEGSVDITVFPGGQLPVYKDNLEQVVNGANWIAVEDLTYPGDYVPDFAALA